MKKKVVWLIYDADTAIGINNEGALVFSYNLEDIDHLSSGADVFNGQESVMWTNLRDAFFADIKAMYKRLRSTGALSYAKVERMFEEHQAKWPEAVFNEDAWFKYLAPLVEKGNATYLTMLQGSKESQRKWWLYNRFKYMDSKYNAGDSLNDFIELRGYAKGDITVTPYADVYASVKYGSYLVQKRALRNRQYTLECPLDTLNDTEIAIYSCSQLSSVGDLSPLKVGRANFSNAVRLQEIKLGDGASTYSNGNLTELTLGNNALLRRLDVRNCPNLVQSVDVSHCTGLEEAYFDGTGIKGIGLPNGGVLKKLHLPETLANLTIRNQPGITEFLMPGYSNISTLWLDNVSTAVPIFDILEGAQAGARVRLVGIHVEMEDTEELEAFYDRLDTFQGLDDDGDNVDRAQVSGTIHLNSFNESRRAEFEAEYPYIAITANHREAVLRYWSEDGQTLLAKENVIDGGDGTKANTETKASTVQYDYAADGWSLTAGGTRDDNALVGVTANRDVYACFSASLRNYTVKFVRAAEDGGGTVYTQQNVPYGTVPTYGGATPTTTKGAAEDYPFETWEPALAAVDGTNLTYTAKFGATFDIRWVTDVSWNAVYNAIEAGTVRQLLKRGNILPLQLPDIGDVGAQVAGFETDTVSVDGRSAPITFLTYKLWPEAIPWNIYSSENDTIPYPEGHGTIGGYSKSNVNNVIASDVVPLLSSALDDRVVAVKKSSLGCDSSGSSFDDVGDYAAWLPGYEEVVVDSEPSISLEYVSNYRVLFDDAEKRKRSRVDNSGEYNGYFLRDTVNSKQRYRNVFCIVGNSGTITNTLANNKEYSIPAPYNIFGFCLGTYEQAHMRDVTWDQVVAWRDEGTIQDNLAIGDILSLDLGTEGVVNALVTGFGVNDLADGSGKSKVSFATYRSIKTRSTYPNLLTTIEAVLPNFPEVLRNNIAEVTVSALNKTLKLYPPIINYEVNARVASERKVKAYNSNSYDSYWVGNYTKAVQTTSSPSATLVDAQGRPANGRAESLAFGVVINFDI